MLQVITTLTQKWQMTLPKEVREVLGLKKPGKVQLLIDRKEKTIKIKTKPSFLKLAGILPSKNFKGERLDLSKVRDYLEKAYQRL